MNKLTDLQKAKEHFKIHPPEDKEEEEGILKLIELGFTVVCKACD